MIQTRALRTETIIQGFIFAQHFKVMRIDKSTSYEEIISIELDYDSKQGSMDADGPRRNVGWKVIF